MVRVLVLVLPQVRELVQPWALALALVLVLVQEQQGQLRHRNRRLQLLESSSSRASIGRCCFSKLRQPHCASCEFLARQPLMQRLRQPGMRRFCLV